MDNKEDYSLERLLGEGGMGKVYLATDNQLQRQVAIKKLTYQTEEKGCNNALNEARLLARVSHANIIQIYNIHDHNNHISLVMEYFESKSLTQFQQENFCSLIQKVDLLRQLASGLAAAHKNNVIHCDLKPTNILVDKHGLLKITDFGIALLATNDGEVIDDQLGKNSSGVDNELFGSVMYMSPEQIQHKTLDYRSDIFSYGIVAYQLMVGSHPFGRGSTQDVAKHICHSTPEHAKNVMLNAPTSLTNLLMQLLVVDVEHRLLTASLIENRLQHIKEALIHAEISEQETVALTELPAVNSELSSPIMTNMTLPYQTNTQLKTQAIVKGKGKLSRAGGQKILVIVATLFLLCFGVLYVQGFYDVNTIKNKQVVILKPRIIDSPLMLPMQQELVTSAVDDALRQAVINTQNMYLISQQEINAVLKEYPDDLNKLKEAVGASDIISTNLVCDNNRCKVSFNRLVAKERQTQRLLVKSERNWLVPIDKFNVIFSASQTQFASLFPEQAEVGQMALAHRAITEKYYRQYISLYNKIKGQGAYDKESLAELETLITNSPYLYAAYNLFRETASNLYLDTRDKTFLAQLDRVLQQSPPEYRYSVYHAIDRFWLAANSGNLELAHKYIKEVKKIAGESLTTIELNAYYYFINGQYKKAINSYENALNLRFSSGVAYNLALSYWYLGDMARVEETLKLILTTMPNHLPALRLQANIWLLQGKLAMAINAYHKIVKRVSNGKELTNLSLAYALNKQHKKSQKFARSAYQISPNNPLRLLNLADIEMILGNDRLAKTYYRKVITMLTDTQDSKYLTNLAQAYAHLHQPELAIATLKKAQKLSPDNAEVSYAAAIVYSVLGDSYSAIYHIKYALQSNVGVVWFNLSWFDKLCRNKEFTYLMNGYDNSQRCQINFE